MSNNNQFNSPVQSSSFGVGISPMTDLSVNLDSSLRIHKIVNTSNVTMEGVDVLDGAALNSSSPIGAVTSPYSRMIKNGNCSPTSGVAGRKCLFRNMSFTASDDRILPPGKENFTCNSSQTTKDDESSSSPSRFRNSAKILAPRNILKYVDDNVSNSFDSGYSNSGASTCSSDDLNRFPENFKFPLGPAPRKLTGGLDCSPKSSSGDTFSSNSPSSPSIFTHQKVFHSFSAGSSDLSDDGFIDQLPDITTANRNIIVNDENAQLPPDFNSLLSGKIFRPPGVIADTTPISSLKSNKDDQLTFKQFLPDSITWKQKHQTAVTPVLIKSNKSIAEDLALLDKDEPSANCNNSGNKNKRSAEREEDTTPFLKRRKSNKLFVNNKLRSFSQPSTAPVMSTSERTLFHYGFNKTSKFQRSFSESETIKQAVQKASSDLDLIGDMTKPFALPLEKLTKHSDLKNISCETLAKLIDGEFTDTVESYTIIDCRYPYEYDGGHIKGAVNIYTKEQVDDEFIIKKLRQTNVTLGSGGAEAAANEKRDILIFHCEFSSERGPNLSRYLRNADRRNNSSQYPFLHYPEMYLLEGGYSEFFKCHKHLCEPCAYLSMLDPKYTNEMKTFRVRSKLWTSVPDYKSKASFRTRLAL